VGSRQHCKLQNRHSSAGDSEGQKALPYPRNEIDVAHVCIPRRLN
jgi:hypothetical protein